MIGSNGGNFGFDMGALLGNMLGNQGGGFGNGNGDLWAIILVIALCGGFRNGGGLFGNGNGGGESSGTAYVDAAIQRGFDNQSVINKLNGLENGICSLGYDQLNQINNVSNTVRQTGTDLQLSLQNLLVALMQQGFAQSTQNQDCCCKIENLLQQANYNRASDTCAITTAIKDAVTAIIQNDNCNYRQLHDEQIALQMQQKDQRISQLESALTRCDTRADNADQTRQIVSDLINAFRSGAANPTCGCNNNWWNNCGWTGYNGFPGFVA